jgi:hypothetical protein
VSPLLPLVASVPLLSLFVSDHHSYYHFNFNLVFIYLLSIISFALALGSLVSGRLWLALMAGLVVCSVIVVFAYDSTSHDTGED